jgi:Flp pilus assembly protein TadG
MRARRVLTLRVERGSVMVEFTFVAPLLVALFLGTVFYGYDFYTYARLEEVVRSGSRFASIQTYDVYSGNDPTPSCGSTTCNMALDQSASAFATRVANFTVYGDPAGGTQPLLENLSLANVAVSIDVKNGVPVGTWVKITGYSMLTPTGRITLNGKPAVYFPFQGNFKVSP